jgi:hypothetical protein
MSIVGEATQHFILRISTQISIHDDYKSQHMYNHIPNQMS